MEREVRRDIQLLRGVAVLLVVFYHADVGAFARGYLGVDVFFVVSGFLITSIILKGLEQEDFSLVAFYLRRAKRLLPALYCTLTFVSLLAYGLISESQRADYVAQLYGAVGFSANMVLPTQVGYFEGSAEGKPLLHIWSLSLEEQYYFILPALLIAAGAWRLWLLIGLLAASLVLCLAWVTAGSGPPPFLWRISEISAAEWAFFLFPTRAWELLVGSLCAYLALYRPIRVPTLAKWTALGTLLLLAAFGIDPVHPRGDALAASIATGLIVLGRDNWLPDRSVFRLTERVGDWSYSVYLTHWPLFSFAFLAYSGLIPNAAKWILIAASLMFGYLQYRWVETPFRYGWKGGGRGVWSIFAVTTLAVLLVPAPMMLESVWAQSPSRADGARRVNIGLSPRCDSWDLTSVTKAFCRNTDHPSVAVWGDSYAMHVVPGLALENGLVQLTKSSCGPLIELAPVSRKYPESWAQKCLEFNRTALDMITGSPEIGTVVLGSSFVQYFGGQYENDFLADGKLVGKSWDRAYGALRQTVEALHQAGKSVLIVAPPPRSGFDIADCVERQAEGLLSMLDGCDVPRAAHLAYDEDVIEALRRVSRESGVRIEWISDRTCDGQTCRTELDGVQLYRDGGHLSIAGAQALFGSLQLERGSVAGSAARDR